MNKTDLWTSRLGRTLVTGSVLIIGGSLAIAQVRNPARAPADPELPAAAPEEPEANPAAKANADQPAAESQDRTAPQAKAKATQPADDPRTPARSPADSPTRPRATDERPAADAPEGRQPASERPAGERSPARPEDDATRRGENRPGLGFQFDTRAEGLTVGTIDEESIAAQAGFREGDRIVSVAGQRFANQRQFEAYLSGQYGRRVPVIIERDGRQYTVQLSLQEPESDGAWLGVYLAEQEGEQAGARITHVYPSGPAARAGLRPGDVVARINGEEIAGTPELIATVDSLQPNAQAEFLVRRGQREVTIPVLLGSRDSFVFYGDDEDERSRGGYGEDDEFGRIPAHAMGLEHDRRMAEQHQRIEMELRKLQDEVRKLREALQSRN